ncbi:MAG: hypothetical protein WCP35_03460 [Verrucomicrobiota bacterium]
MDLPENLTTPIRSRLKGEAALSDPGVEEILKGLEGNTPINWNLLLNKELTPAKTDETND